MRLKTKKTKKGFSIGEVMISAFVLAVGLVAIAGLVAKSTSYSILNRNRIIASALSQEGVELIRNIRDNNMANGIAGAGNNDFDKFFPSSLPADNCRIDKDYSYAWSSSSNDVNCGNDTTYPKRLNLDSNNYYIHATSGTTPTKFYRQIKVENFDIISLNDSRKVTSSVWWGSATKPGTCDIANQCVEVETILSDWRQYSSS